MSTPIIPNSRRPVKSFPPVPPPTLKERLAEANGCSVDDLPPGPPWERRGKGWQANVNDCRLFVMRSKFGDGWCLAIDGEWRRESYETRDGAMSEAEFLVSEDW
jgi:hypothetical protein